MRRLLSVVVLALASLSFSPAQAGGLLQDLFAPAPRVAPIVTYYAPVQPQIRFLADPGLRVSRRLYAPRKAVVKRPQTRHWATSRKGAAIAALAPAARFGVERGHRSGRAHVMKSRAKIASLAAPAVLAQPAPAVARIETPAQIENDPTLRIGDAYMTPEGLRIYRGPQAKTRQSKTFVDFRRSDLGKGVKSQLAALEGATRGALARHVAPPVLKAIAARADGRKSVDRQGRVIRVVGP
ncbi:MAG TPA: hypothetical protein PKA55_10020 [Rhodoblastus sp.]|nr:hypothetical protein [Rhodoblastus sp.]